MVALWDAEEPPTFLTDFVMGPEKSVALSIALDGVAAPARLDVKRGGLHLVEKTPFGLQPWSDYDAFRNRATARASREARTPDAKPRP